MEIKLGTRTVLCAGWRSDSCPVLHTRTKPRERMRIARKSLAGLIFDPALLPSGQCSSLYQNGVPLTFDFPVCIMRLLANSPDVVNTKMRILWSVRPGHCLIVSGSPPQQVGRHRVDIGIYGMNIYANVRIHSFAPQGLKSAYYVPSTVITQRGAHLLRTRASLEEKAWGKVKECPRGHR